MMTDLVSVPRPLRWLVERVGPHLEATIVHDFLFIAWDDIGKQLTRDDWRFANRVMIAGMEEARIRWWICAFVSFAISTWFSWRIFRRKKPAVRYVRVPD